jgi:hypothetical protein
MAITTGSGWLRESACKHGQVVIDSPSNLSWFRSTSSLTITTWALFGAASSFAVYDSSTFAFKPVAAWAASWTTTLISASWLMAPIMLCPALAAVLGWRYLRGLGPSGRRWRAAWFSVAIVGLLLEPLLIWSAEEFQFPQTWISAPNPLWPLTGFLLVGTAMITMLATAGRK